MVWDSNRASDIRETFRNFMLEGVERPVNTLSTKVSLTSKHE